MQPTNANNEQPNVFRDGVRVIHGVFPDLPIVVWRIEKRYSRGIPHIKQNLSSEFRKNQTILRKYVFFHIWKAFLNGELMTA